MSDTPQPAYPSWGRAVGSLVLGRWKVLQVSRVASDAVRLLAENLDDGTRAWVRQSRGRSENLRGSAAHSLHAERAPDAIGADEAARLRNVWTQLSVRGLARVLDVAVDGDSVFVVTRFVDGPTMEEAAREGLAWDEAELLERAASLSATLGALHVNGVVAGALAPDTVVVSADGPLLIELDAERTLRALARGRSVDPRVDVYALGALLYSGASHMAVASAGDRLMETSPPSPLGRLNASISAATAAAVEQMLQVEPSRRPADMAEVRRLLGIAPLLIIEPDVTVAQAASSLASSALRVSGIEACAPPSAPHVPDPLSSASSSPPPARSAPSQLGSAAARRRNMRPITYSSAVMALITLLVLGSAWVVRLLYVVTDDVRVKVDPSVLPQPPRVPVGVVVPRGSALPPTLTGGDGTVMVLVPGGSFPMGVPNPDELDGPSISENLGPYYIDRTLVTCAQFARFISTSGWIARGAWRQYVNPDKMDNPITGVTAEDAAEYARWCGKRLPTEMEWEKAARGSAGRTWPWGDTLPDARMAALFADTAETTAAPQAVDACQQGASPYGVLDMAGNVWEWTASAFEPYSGSRAKNDLFGHGLRVVRGGSWVSGMQDARSTVRMPVPPRLWSPDIGFRCVVSADSTARNP